MPRELTALSEKRKRGGTMAKCKSCGAEITFVKTIGGKAMPCYAKAMPYAEGYGNDTIITPNGETTKGAWIDIDEHERSSCAGNGMLASMDRAAEPDGIGYAPHWATCPSADRHRKKGEKA